MAPTNLPVTTILLVSMAWTARGEDPARLVPLNQIYSSSGQSGLLSYRSIQLVADDAPRRELSRRMVFEPINARHSGDQTIFLLRAMNAGDALRATELVLKGGKPVDAPVTARRHEDEEEPTPWLFFYLGVSHSTPHAFEIDPIEITDSTVRVTYRKTNPEIATCDQHGYRYWAPLGRLKPGHYELQLYDDGLDWQVLTRRLYVSH